MLMGRACIARDVLRATRRRIMGAKLPAVRLRIGRHGSAGVVAACAVFLVLTLSLAAEAGTGLDSSGISGTSFGSAGLDSLGLDSLGQLSGPVIQLQAASDNLGSGVGLQVLWPVPIFGDEIVQVPWVAAGYGSVRWGAGRYGTLILDDRAAPYPFLQAGVGVDTPVGRVEYSRLLGKLGPQPDTYLLGQRVELSPTGWLRLGVTEIAIADGRFARMPTNWIPLWPFYLTQHLAIRSGVEGINDDSNQNLGLDVTAALTPGITVYGEFFVDDMPQRPENGGVYQTGFLLGGTADLGKSFRLDAEYARVNNYTYTFRVPERSYLNQGRPLGFQLGPDADRLIVALRKRSEGTELGVGLEFRRHGEGRIGDRWQDIGRDAARERAFLYSVVEYTALVRFDLMRDFASGARLEAGVAVGQVRNKDNVPSGPEGVVEARLGIRWTFGLAK